MRSHVDSSTRYTPPSYRDPGPPPPYTLGGPARVDESTRRAASAMRRLAFPPPRADAEPAPESTGRPFRHAAHGIGSTGL